VVRDMGVTDRKRPQFLALQLANEIVAGDLLQTTPVGDNPTWNQPAINSLRAPFNGAHYLQSFAFAEGTRRAVIVFNLHRTDSLSVNFTGPNAPTGVVTLRRLTATNITDTNENAQTVTISEPALSNFAPGQSLALPPFSMSVLTWSTSPAAAPASRLINVSTR